MINYTDNYFDLELLKLTELKLHEATENKRLRNIFNRISRAKYLMNPVITGRHNDDIILLDGANRFGSLKEIGCKLILAQVLNYNDKNLILDKWNHLIYDFHIDRLKEHCEVFELPVRRVSFSKGLEMLDDNLNYILAADIFKDENIVIKLSHELEEILMQLDTITKLYFKHFPFDRSESDIKFADIRKYTRRKGTLLVFPKFKKHHIVEISNSRYRLPAGISRHRIFNRVLHVKYEIRKLMSDRNIHQKQEELKKLLNEKIDNNKVRQYQESVIVFDE